MNRISSGSRRRRVVPPSPPHRQKGAAAVFGYFAILMGILCMLLSFNVGALYYAKRDLQRQATLAALAGVEIGSGCRNGGVPGTLAAATDAVVASLRGNSNLSDSEARALLTGINGQAGVQLGRIDTSTGLRVFVPLTAGDSRIDSVRVNITSATPQIIGGYLTNAGVLQASATAQQQPLGAFSIGSTLANLNTSKSVLNPLLSGLLGASVNLSAVDYQGLAQTQLTLAGLMAAANVTDLNQLLQVNTNLAGLQQILTAATNTVNPSVAQLIQGLTLGNAQANTGVALADLLGNVGNGLNPTITDVASQVPFVDVLDMLTALGEAAAAKNGITLTLPVSVNVPGLLNTYAFLQVLQPPQLSGLGPVGTSQHTAQIILKIRTNVDSSGVLGLLNALAKATINLGIDVNVAVAQGTISNLACPSDLSPHPSATVAVTTGLTTLQLGAFTGNPQSAPDITAVDQPLLNVTLLGATIVKLGVKQPPSTTLGSGSGNAGPFINYASPPTLLAGTSHNYLYQACNNTVENPCTALDPTNPQTPVSSVNIASGITTLVGNLAAKNNLSVDVLGIGLGGLLDPIIAALNTALLTPITSLVDSLLNPLLAALGVQVGSGTLLWQEFETGQPVVVSTNLPGTTAP